MREEFKIAYKKAQEVLEKISCRRDEMVRTASVIEAVEEILGIRVKFTEYNFEKLSNNVSNKVDLSDYGAAMCISHKNEDTFALILLNERATTEMKRFSLVHELGHLITKPSIEAQPYQVSTHINMNITTIPDSILDDEKYAFLIDEQVANIFALLVLIPYDMLVEAFDKYQTLEAVAQFFGVEKDALISRMILEQEKMILGQEKMILEQENCGNG